MSRFVRRWSNWGTSGAPASGFDPETPSLGTDKADKIPSVGFVSRQGQHPDLDLEGGPRKAVPEIGPEKPSQRTDKTDKRASVSSVSGQGERSQVDSVAGRCSRCRTLEAQGVRILLCSCGHTAKLPPAPRPQPQDLGYSLAHVRRHAPDLSPVQRESFDYWLDLYLDGGWSREDAERAAFRRAMLPPPAPRRRE